MNLGARFLAASVVLTLSLTACAPRMFYNPAGRLQYPGSTLLHTNQSFGDSTDVTRVYADASRPTAEEVLAWYKARLTADGYYADPPAPTVDIVGAASSAELFFYANPSGQDNPGYQIYVSVTLPHRLPAKDELDQASPRALRMRVSSFEVSIS